MPEHTDPGLVELLSPARKVLIFAGAGISTSSGIRDYRGPQGVWKTQDPVYYQDFLTSEEARVRYWESKLVEVAACQQAEPNPVHHAIVTLERAGRLELCVTQNIDGLHRRAGTSEERLVEVHGTNLLVECQSCQARSEPGPHLAAFEAERRAPLCEACGGLLKPATISFGQSLREGDLLRAFAAAEACDLAISLGSTLAVYPAAGVPATAAQRGTPYVIINRGPTEHDGQPFVTLRLEGDVTEIFPPAVQAACAD